MGGNFTARIPNRAIPKRPPVPPQSVKIKGRACGKRQDAAKGLRNNQTTKLPVAHLLPHRKDAASHLGRRNA